MSPLLVQDRSSDVALRPGPDILTLIARLTDEPEKTVGTLFGPNGTAIYMAIIKAAGMDGTKNWGICPSCGGTGYRETYPGQRAEAEAWECTEPPTGEGWQLWTTVNEGAPVSPVFPDSEHLARWLTTDRGAAMAGMSSGPMTISSARAFVEQHGWAPSHFLDAGGVHSGPDYLGTSDVLDGIRRAANPAENRQNPSQVQPAQLFTEPEKSEGPTPDE